MLNMFGSYAEYERTSILERSNRGRMDKAKRRKLIVGNVAPYGFDYIKRDKDKGVEVHYTKRQDEISIVKRMFELADVHGYIAR